MKPECHGSEGKPKIIKVSKDGPYLVSGRVPISVKTIVSDQEGTAVGWRQMKKFPLQDDYALCRCGQSKKKPFCDGAHLKARFRGKETATEGYLKKPEKHNGQYLRLDDFAEICASARFCHRAGGIWELIKKKDDPEAKRTVIEEASDCPSGRLVIVDKATEKALEPDLEPSIAAIDDPFIRGIGPLWVRGRIPVVSADGKTYVVRNRVTLCRCGKSENKPFCDSSHYPEEDKHG